MDTYKIDILKLNNTIVLQDLKTQEQKYFTISELLDKYLVSYNDFISLVDSKITDSYTQIYVAKEPVIRFATIGVNYITISNYQEVLYDDLTRQEKIIFDTFYNLFSS